MVKEALFQNVGSKDKLVDRVVAIIQQLILDGQLEPGMRLPPEREFAERLGVSRTVLREAVRILVTKGLLETRHGVGTLVRQVTNEQFLEPLSLLLRTYDLSIEQLYQVRSILEVGTVRLAACQAGADEQANLRRIVDEMAASTGDIPRFIALDDEYHQAIALATHNPLLVLLSHTVESIMHEVRTKVHAYSRVYNLALPDHREILAALEACDADAAAAAMLRHLDNARRFQEEYVALERGRVVSSQALDEKPTPETNPA